MNIDAAADRSMSIGRIVGLSLAAAAAVWFVFRPASGEGHFDPATVARGERAAALDASHRVVPFTVLAGFEYREPAHSRRASSVSSVPREIAALDGQLVAVDGFMLPLDHTKNGVSTFVLNASYDMCAFGAPSTVNERIDVKMAGGRRTVYTHYPIRVYGRFKVEEQIERGKAVGLYAMEAEAIGPAGLGY